MAHQQNQGVTAQAVAPFSFDCEVIVKFVGMMISDIWYDEIDLLS